jgi:dinuclear metal center YbgI/SA1388 family protein
MANRDDIIRFCNDLLMVDRWKDFGPIGPQFIGKAKVDNIVTGVSTSVEFLRAAAAAGADMVIVHHGEFWDNKSQVVDPVRKARLKILLDHDITLLAYHLPLDGHPDIGNNALLAKAAGMTPTDTPFAVYQGNSVGLTATHDGIGRVEFVDRLAKAVGTDTPRVFAFGPDTVCSAGFVSGGGAGSLQEAVDLGLDAFVTGESKEANYHLAKEAGINLIYLGHYNSEKPGVDALGQKIAGKFGLPATFIDIPCEL